MAGGANGNNQRQRQHDRDESDDSDDQHHPLVRIRFLLHLLFVYVI